MKIRRLDLIAYGPFQDQPLAFESDGLHLVFGPNEAGKSTALRALQAVLYGMTDKRDAFRHPWDMMRVGMSVETADGIITVERRKGKGARSLVYAGTERAVSPEEWSRVLPVLDQNLFLQMFGLDYQRLVAGGRELAEGKGDIGQALLAAAGDLGGAVERMRGFQRRTSDLFQPHARSQSKLSVALRQYKDAERRIRSEKFSSHAYRTAVRELEDKRRESERLAGEIRACAGEHQRLTRLQQAAPGVALLAQKKRDLAAMAAIPVLSPDFTVRHENAVKLLGKSLTTAENSQAELNRLTQRLAGIKRDPVLANLKIEIEQLFAQSGRIDAGRKDRPKREGELRQLRDAVARNLRLLGLDLDPVDCMALRVKLVQRNEIARLAEEHPKLTTRMEEAMDRADSLRTAAEENRLALAELPACPDTSELERQLAALAGTSTEADLAKLRGQLVLAQGRAEADLNALPLFSGTGEDLERLSAPLTATVRAYQGRYTEQDTAERRLSADETAATVEIAKFEQDIQLLEEQGEVPTESDLDHSRTRRDLGWTAVKHRWLKGAPASAETDFLSGAGSGQPLDVAYEYAVGDVDNIADGLRLHASQVEKKVLWLEQVTRRCENLARTRQSMQEAAERRRELDLEWRSLWVPGSIELRSPDEMLDWLDRRRDAIEQFRAANSLRQQVGDVEDQIGKSQVALKHAIEALNVGTDGSLAEFVEIGRRIVKRAEHDRTEKRDLEREQKRLDSESGKTEKRRSELEQALAKWSRDWAGTISGLPVPPGARPDAVQEVVRLLDAVAADSEQINALVHRIQTMERDDQGFSAAVEQLAARSGVPSETSDSLITIRKLYAAATAAAQNEEAAAMAEKEIDNTSDRLREALLEAERQRKDLAALCPEAGVQEPDSLAAAIEQSGWKRSLSEQVEEQRLALVPACAGRGLEELVQAVAALDMDALPAQLAELGTRQQDYERQRHECVRRAVELEQEFQMHESAASLSDAVAEKQDAGARIAYLAEEYLEQEIAARLMSAAIERYRSRHQDPLLQRAGQHLESLTCGSFTGLAIDFDEANRRVLRAVRRDSGEHLDVAGMSDGARDQLFFALRLAYIEEHSTRIGACPVILDDVLMAFDNDRATAALRVLVELAKTTQVLLFTHHAHHIQLARGALDEAEFTVHELASAHATVQ